MMKNSFWLVLPLLLFAFHQASAQTIMCEYEQTNLMHTWKDGHKVKVDSSVKVIARWSQQGLRAALSDACRFCFPGIKNTSYPSLKIDFRNETKCMFRKCYEYFSGEEIPIPNPNLFPSKCRYGIKYSANHPKVAPPKKSYRSPHQRTGTQMTDLYEKHRKEDAHYRRRNGHEPPWSTDRDLYK